MSSKELGKTLFQYLIAQVQHNDRLKNIQDLMNNIQTAIKEIDYLIRRADLPSYEGVPPKSLYFEDKFESKVDEIFSKYVISSNCTCMLLSPHSPSPVIIETDQNIDKPFIVCFDPLDGTSTIDTLVPTGTIFSIYRKTDSEPPSSSDILQKGSQVVACGYAIYGSATKLVFSVGEGVHEFLLHPNVGEFVMEAENLRIPNRGSVYSINEGYSSYWYQPLQTFITQLKNPPAGESAFSSRYTGSMVADVHRTIKYGGIFMYPATKESPRGKLRLMYACIPMSFLVEQCGGRAVTFDPHPTPILSIPPSNPHQRIPIFLGSTQNIQQLLDCFDSLE